MKRVVVTGMAGITSLGSDWDSIAQAVIEKRNGIRYMTDWDVYADLNTRLAGPIPDFAPPAHFTRKKTRSMGRVSLMATAAAETALRDAGLLDHPVLHSGHAGVAFGRVGSAPPQSRAGGPDPALPRAIPLELQPLQGAGRRHAAAGGRRVSHAATDDPRTGPCMEPCTKPCTEPCTKLRAC
jgi:hypothetical protein